jgi:hypothetical protein
MLLRSSLVNRSRLSLKGKGLNLPDPVLPLTGPVVVQVINHDSNVCWESTFPTAKKSTETRYKAKAQ